MTSSASCNLSWKPNAPTASVFQWEWRCQVTDAGDLEKRPFKRLKIPSYKWSFVPASFWHFQHVSLSARFNLTSLLGVQLFLWSNLYWISWDCDDETSFFQQSSEIWIPRSFSQHNLSLLMGPMRLSEDPIDALILLIPGVQCVCYI